MITIATTDFAMKRLSVVLIGLMTLAAYPVYAHTRLSAATPADAEVITSAPEEIVLEFSTDVRLLSVTLAHADGAAIELGALPAETRAQFALPIMVDLMPGEYLVTWRAVGADTHAVSGDLSFVVTQTEAVASH
jgi:methionine-rich copper-binding protein CopC